MKRGLDSYVPAKLWPYFEYAMRDSDGIWFYFNSEYVRFFSTDCGIVHEDTISRCRIAMRDYEILKHGTP